MDHLNQVFSQTSSIKRLPKVDGLDFAYEISLFKKHKASYSKSSLILPAYEKTSKDDSQCVINQLICPGDTYIRKALISSSLFYPPDFKLVLYSSLSEPICKGKYFSFKVLLRSIAGIVFPASEILPLEAIIYSNDDMVLTKNIQGEEILKGNRVQNMHYFKMEKQHVAYFRIQITEVSSHFIGKTINLKIKPCRSSFLMAMGWKVQSLVLPHLRIIAKKSSRVVNPNN
jgi:hypothetical protein